MLRLQGGADIVIFPENAEEDNKKVYFGYIYKDKETYLHYENDPKAAHTIKPFDQMMTEFMANPKGFLWIAEEDGSLRIGIGLGMVLILASYVWYF